MKVVLLTLFIVLNTFFINTCTAQDGSKPQAKKKHHESELWNALFEDYTPQACPTSDNATVIHTQFHFTNLVGFDSIGQHFSLNGFFNLTWHDPRLVWDPAEYGNVKMIFADTLEVWKPDIVHYSGAQTTAALGWEFMTVAIHHDGLVNWMPGNLLMMACQLDLHQFPFDSQVCRLFMTAWAHTTDQIILDLNSHVGRNDFKPHSEWDLTHIELETYDEYAGKWAAFDVVMGFKRKPDFYILVLIVPMILASILNCFVYVLPSKSGERVSLSVTAFLTYTIFISYITEKVPANADNIPYVAYILVIQSSMTAIALFVNILLVRMDYVLDSYLIAIFHRCLRDKQEDGSTEEEMTSLKSGTVDDAEGLIVEKLRRKLDTTCFLLTLIVSLLVFFALVFMIAVPHHFLDSTARK